jgi:hypothetical protein
VLIDADGFLDARTLPTTGTYTILLDPGVNTGTVTFALQSLHKEKAARIALRKRVKIRKPGENASVLLKGVAGQRLSLARSAETLPPGSTDITIFGPDGVMLVPPARSGTLSFTLPLTGNYRILVDPVGADIGQLDLTLTDCSQGGC